MTVRPTPERLAEIRARYGGFGAPLDDLFAEIDALRAEHATEARALDELQAIVAPVVVESDDTLADVVRRLIAERDAAVKVAEAARLARDASEPRVEDDPVLGRVSVSGGAEEFAADEALADALDAWEAR